MTRILLNTPYQVSDSDRAELSRACAGLEFRILPATAPGELDGHGIEILVTEQVPRALADWKSLRLVQLLSAGANQLAGHPIWDTGIPICTASGTHSVPIAQYVTAAWLMMVHRFPALAEFQRSRVWPNRVALAGRTVRGMTAGIFGYGSIGRECARQLNALGMQIVCLKRDAANHGDEGFNAWPDTGDPCGDLPVRWFAPTQLREMLPLCDVLVVTAPGTPQTFGAIGCAELELLKKSARVIVVSRGGIVDEPALADALRAGRLAGAAVDCFAKEPLDRDHVFFETPNIILTPHMSGVYDAFWPAFVRLLAANLACWKSGQPLLNRTDGRGY